MESQWQAYSAPLRQKDIRSLPGLSLPFCHTHTHTHKFCGYSLFSTCVCRVVCELRPSGKERKGPVQVRVGAAPPGGSLQEFTYQVGVNCPERQTEDNVTVSLSKHANSGTTTTLNVLKKIPCAPQDPQLLSLLPDKGPVSGGTRLTIKGRQLLTGQKSDLSAFLGAQPCYM